MVNVRDVAKASGVSISTVSYIINNKQISISEKTRQRVIDTMRELNYKPTPKAKKSNQRRLDIGVFIGTGPINIPNQSFCMSILEGILIYGTSEHHNVTVYSGMTWVDIRQDLREYIDGRCDGIILISPGVDADDLCLAIHERAIPAVKINTASDSDIISTLDIDDYKASYEAVKYLVNAGHRKIAMLGSHPSHHTVPILRDNGFKSALSEYGIECKQEWMPNNDYNWQSGYDRTMKMFKNKPRKNWPTAIFCHCDTIAYGVYKAFEDLSISIPNDVSIISIDDIPIAKELNPPLTTMRQPLQQLGNRATEIIIEEILKNPKDRIVHKEILSTELVIRKSVAAVAP